MSSKIRKGRQTERRKLLVCPLVPPGTSVYTKTYTFIYILKQIKIIEGHQPSQTKLGYMSRQMDDLFP